METIVKLIPNRSEYDIRNASANSVSVAEFIEILENYPKDAKIVFDNDYGYTFGYINANVVKTDEIETFEEEKAREEQEENEILVCPHCESDNICWSVRGHMCCLDCDAKFKKAKLISNGVV